MEADLGYLKQLIGAGWEGVASAPGETGSSLLAPSRKAGPWTTAAAGAALGILGARLIARRKNASTLAMGGMTGSIVGFGAAMAWASRSVVRVAARNAIRRVNAERDAHWLAMNPIDYA
jgi:hypothetical protein